MAKTKYLRRYRKKAWAANISEIVDIRYPIAADDYFYIIRTLVTNPAQDPGTVSQTYTVKNVEATFEFNTDTSNGTTNLEAITAFIMYVPQGMNIDGNYARNHPEYILNYRFLGSAQNDSTAYRNPIRVKTRLARRLNTGDQIILFITGTSTYTQSLNLYLSGMIRWWTKAN